MISPDTGEGKRPRGLGAIRRAGGAGTGRDWSSGRTSVVPDLPDPMSMPHNAPCRFVGGATEPGKGERCMDGREELLHGIGELAAHYEMTYFG